MPTDTPGPWPRSQVTFHVIRTATNQVLATRYVPPSIAKRLRVPEKSRGDAKPAFGSADEVGMAMKYAIPCSFPCHACVHECTTALPLPEPCWREALVIGHRVNSSASWCCNHAHPYWVAAFACTREALNKSMFVILNRRQAVRNLLYSWAPEDFSLRSK